ncbi:MAG: hypothetical protein ACOYWZ_03120 [Bacillota bacterium]
MKIMFSNLLKKWAQGIVELLFFFPVILGAASLLLPQSSIWLLVGSLILFYLIGIAAGYALKKRKRFFCLLASLPAAGLAAYLFVGFNPWAAVIFFIYLYISYRGILFTQVPWEKVFPETALWGGLAVYFISYFVFTRVQELKQYTDLLTWAGIASVAIYLFLANMSRLSSMAGTAGKKAAPASLVIHNRITITVTLLVIFIVSSFTVLKSGIAWLWGMVLKLLGLITGWLYKLLDFDTGGTEMPQNERPEMLAGGSIPLIVAVFFIILGCAVFLAVCVFIYKSTKGFSKMSLNVRRKRGIDTGYEDEEESLMDWGNIKNSYAEGLKRRLSKLFEKELKWSDLTSNKERIRYIYRRLLLDNIASGYSFKAHFTPLETVRDMDHWKGQKQFDTSELATLYNQVRYGDNNIYDDHVEKVKNTLFPDLH